MGQKNVKFEKDGACEKACIAPRLPEREAEKEQKEEVDYSKKPEGMEDWMYLIMERKRKKRERKDRIRERKNEECEHHKLVKQCFKCRQTLVF